MGLAYTPSSNREASITTSQRSLEAGTCRKYAPAAFESPTWKRNGTQMQTKRETAAWMSQEVSKWLGSMGYNLLINGVFLGVITHLLTIYYLPGTSKWRILWNPYVYYKSLWIQVAARNARKGYNLEG